MSEYDEMSYEQLEQLSNELRAEQKTLKARRLEVAMAMDRKRIEELRSKPPAPGQIIGT